jgi:hypothetical protein
MATLTVLGRRKFSNVQWHDHGGRPDAESYHKSAHGELCERKRSCLEDCSNHEDYTSGPDGHFSSESIGCESSSNGSDQSSTAGQGSDQLLLARRQNVTQTSANGDQHRGYVTGIVAEQEPELSACCLASIASAFVDAISLTRQVTRSLKSTKPLSKQRPLRYFGHRRLPCLSLRARLQHAPYVPPQRRLSSRIRSPWCERCGRS